MKNSSGSRHGNGAFSTMSTNGGWFLRNETTSQRVRTCMLDVDADLAPEQVERRPRRGRACCRASGRTSRYRRACRGDAASASRSWSCDRGGVIVSTRTSTSRPSHASFRSSPIPSWSASSSLSRRRFDVRRDVVGEPRRRRARSWRVRGGEDLVVTDRLEQTERRPELLVGLAAEPDDDVGRDRDARARLRGCDRAARGSARSCTGGPSGGAPRRRPTGPAGGGARRRSGTRPSPRSIDPRGPTGAR